MGALPSIEMGKEKESEKGEEEEEERKSGCGCWGPIRMYMREGAREMKETKRWMDGWMDGWIPMLLAPRVDTGAQSDKKQ
jgi:hypothetical protein